MERVGETTGVDLAVADELWATVCELFTDEDDSPIPEIRLQRVPVGAATAIWDRLLQGADVLPPDATVWLTAEETDVPVRSLPDLAARAERNEVSAMHVVVRNVTANGLGLPDLGVSIYPGEIALDYRVNVWEPITVAAFLSLLIELQTLAPGSEIVAADEVGHHYDNRAQTQLASAMDRLRAT